MGKCSCCGECGGELAAPKAREILDGERDCSHCHKTIKIENDIIGRTIETIDTLTSSLNSLEASIEKFNKLTKTVKK